jgi:hypothetical protein
MSTVLEEKQVNGTNPAVIQDLPEYFHPVVEKHGRAMFDLCLHAGMGGQATQILLSVVQKHRSQHGTQALGRLANGFNEISSAYAKKMGWSLEQLAECDRDLQFAFKGAIIPAGSRIILDS